EDQRSTTKSAGSPAAAISPGSDWGLKVVVAPERAPFFRPSPGSAMWMLRGSLEKQRISGGESGSRAFGFSALFGLPPQIANSCRRLHLTGKPFARRLPSLTFLCRFCRRHGTRNGTRARNLSRRRVLNRPVVCEGRDAASICNAPARSFRNCGC